MPFSSLPPYLQTSIPPLHRLKTAFSPVFSRPGSAASPTSDLSPTEEHASLFSSASYSSSSSRSSASRLRQMLLLRHRPSILEVGLENEKREFGGAVELFEPRPAALGMGRCGSAAGISMMHETPIVAGIFEVLEGAA